MINIIHLLGIISFIYFYLINGDLFYTSLGLSLSVYFSFDFLNKIGKEYPLKELIILLMLYQWIVGAKISYSFGKMHYKYYMYVNEETYMSYVVPAVIFFIVGIYLVRNKVRLFELASVFKNENILQLKKVSRILIIIGLSSIIIDYFLSNLGGLSFIIYLSSLLLYVGISYLFFIFPSFKTYLFLITLMALFMVSIGKGSFHNLLLVGIFLVFILFNEKTTFIKKASLLLVGVMLTYSIQLIKHEYRSKIWGKKDVNYTQEFSNLIQEEYFTDEQDIGITSYGNQDIEEQANANTRLNQGWIISKVLDNVPANLDFLGGKTIIETIEASILPRFLFPNKPGAELALDNFRLISGLKLNNKTSMGLSIVAEFYANYGILGGWCAMFLYGFLLAVIINFLIKRVGKNSPVMIIWFMFFFFQVVKAETDLIKVVNHLFKAIIFYFFLDFSFKLFNIRIFKR